MLSIPAEYYALERGLRFRICMPELSGLRGLLVSGGSHARAGIGRLRIETLTASELKARNPQAKIVFRDRSQISLPAEQERLSGSMEDADVPVIFPAMAPVLAVRDTGISLIYKIEDRFLTVDVEDRGIAERFSFAFAQLGPLINGIPNASADVFVSEIYFPSQGPAFVELSSAADGSTNALLVSDLGKTVHLRGRVFAGSAIVPEIAFKSRLDVTTASGTSAVQESSLPPGAGKIRSHSADSPGSRASLLPSTACKAPDSTEPMPCHTRGISPQMFKADSGEDNARFCTPEDLALKELNPFGFETDGSLNPSGKFIEFEVMRSCESGRIVLFAPLEIDAGHRRLEQGQRLVVAADAQFYESAVIENSRMRSFAADRAVQILSLREYTLHTVFAGFSAEDLWIPRSGRRIHSLLMEGGEIVFHGPAGAGLRPDQAHNAMSPGHSVNSAPGEARLNEVYPTGSFHTSSIPGDEFFETTGTEGSGMFTLEVQRLRDGKRVLHRFPPSQGFAAYFANSPVCFQTDWTRAGLFLPNEAAHYTLYDSQHRIVDRVEIDASLYTILERDRRSLIAGDPWTRSAPGGSCVRSGATPGAPNEAAAP